MAQMYLLHPLLRLVMLVPQYFQLVLLQRPSVVARTLLAPTRRTLSGRLSPLLLSLSLWLPLKVLVRPENQRHPTRQ